MGPGSGWKWRVGTWKARSQAEKRGRGEGWVGRSQDADLFCMCVCVGWVSVAVLLGVGGWLLPNWERRFPSSPLMLNSRKKKLEFEIMALCFPGWHIAFPYESIESLETDIAIAPPPFHAYKEVRKVS